MRWVITPHRARSECRRGDVRVKRACPQACPETRSAPKSLPVLDAADQPEQARDLLYPGRATVYRRFWDGRPAPRSDRAGSARLSGSRTRSSSFNEVEKVGVQFVSVCDCEAVRRTGIDLEHGVLDDVGRRSGRGIDRDNLVIIAMDDQLATLNFCRSGV